MTKFLSKRRTTALSHTITTIKETVTNREIVGFMSAGWVIVSSWMDSTKDSWLGDDLITINGMSFRMAYVSERIILPAKIVVTIPDSTVLNTDADSLGSKTRIIPVHNNELWLSRAVIISGFGTSSGGGPGSLPRRDAPKISVLGLDIKATTHERKGMFPLPHDDIISICFSNAAWYDNVGNDVCYCVHVFGKACHVELEKGRKPIIIKANNSTEAYEMTYMILKKLSPVFIAIHNGFGFDVKKIAAHSAALPWLAKKMEKRRLGKSGTGYFWRLANGTGS